MLNILDVHACPKCGAHEDDLEFSYKEPTTSQDERIKITCLSCSFSCDAKCADARMNKAST